MVLKYIEIFIYYIHAKVQTLICIYISDTEKAPASPHTTRAGGADRDGHPGGVKARGGGGKAEE